MFHMSAHLAVTSIDTFVLLIHQIEHFCFHSSCSVKRHRHHHYWDTALLLHPKFNIIFSNISLFWHIFLRYYTSVLCSKKQSFLKNRRLLKRLMAAEHFAVSSAALSPVDFLHLYIHTYNIIAIKSWHPFQSEQFNVEKTRCLY